MDIEFRTGFEAAFGYETRSNPPHNVKYVGVNVLKGISYIPVVSTIAWGILLCQACKIDQSRTELRAFTARMVICVVGLGFLLPIPDLIATILLHTNKAYRSPRLLDFDYDASS